MLFSLLILETNLVKNVSISLVARNDEGLIVGVLLGLTDFCYWLYITDLGVDRNYERQGIATKLMKHAGEVMKYNHIDWTEWTVK